MNLNLNIIDFSKINLPELDKNNDNILIKLTFRPHYYLSLSLQVIIIC